MGYVQTSDVKIDNLTKNNRSHPLEPVMSIIRKQAIDIKFLYIRFCEDYDGFTVSW